MVEGYLELRPENEGRLRTLIEAGRIVIGPWLVQPDEFLPSGESHIRSFQRGIRYANRLPPERGRWAAGREVYRTGTGPAHIRVAVPAASAEASRVNLLEAPGEGLTADDAGWRLAFASVGVCKREVRAPALDTEPPLADARGGIGYCER